MGKATIKGGPGRDRKQTGRKMVTAKVAAKPTSTLSKRQTKMKQRRKVAAHARHGALVTRLVDTKTADAVARAPVNNFKADGLFDALDDIAAASPAAPAAAKNAPTGRTNRGKRHLVAAESAQLGAVLAHPAFAANPLGAIFAHLDATLPPAPERPRPAGEQSKKKKRKATQ